jgi:hypothetical protein
MWNLIIGPVVNAVSGFFSDRAKIKQAKVEGKVKLLQSASDSISDWEQLHAKGSQTSWKDEWVLIMFSIIFIMGFIVVGTFNGPAIVTAGFAAFATAPQWFSYTFVSICLASFGIRVTGAVKGLMGK